jgi:hypothetical protein
MVGILTGRHSPSLRYVPEPCCLGRETLTRKRVRVSRAPHSLIFRLAHNFIFFFLSPRQRVHLALAAMAAATGVLAIAMCIAKSPWIGWVFIAYFLGGVSIGTFESNFLACITPLGHQTKKWAIFGTPVGFNFISVGGFLLLLGETPISRELTYLLLL